MGLEVSCELALRTIVSKEFQWMPEGPLRAIHAHAPLMLLLVITPRRAMAGVECSWRGSVRRTF